MRVFIGLIWLAGVIGLLWGCSPPKDRQGGQAGPPPKREDYPKLQSQLFELATAKDPESYAKRHGLNYEDGTVQVEIEVQDPNWVEDLRWAIDALGGWVETSYESLIQARLPLRALLKLAKHPRVLLIRAPVKPSPGGRR